jgi:hypothetical protein
MQNNHTFDDSFITKKVAKAKKKQTNLDDFIGEVDDYQGDSTPIDESE